MNAFEFRLAKIERQLRSQRTIIAGLLIALAALMGYGASEGIPDVIRARKFVAVNEEGREVVVIESWKRSGYITTYPGKGKYLPSISLVPTFRSPRFLIGLVYYDCQTYQFDCGRKGNLETVGSIFHGGTTQGFSCAPYFVGLAGA